MNVQTLNKELGNIDIYLLDQILKARYSTEERILDAGCGEGRNLVYFLNNHFKVYGIDQNPSALQMLKFLARSIDPEFDSSRISTGSLDKLPYDDQYFSHIICTAVLHFAESKYHFNAMMRELIRVLKPGGSIFIRMDSNIGVEDNVIARNNDQYQAPDGSIRFLLTKNILRETMEKCQLAFLEPLQTMNVNDLHCHSNLLLERVNR